MSHSKNTCATLLVAITLWSTITIQGQSVTITEEIKSLPTYGFGKPNPVPIVAENSKIVPYFKFEEYEQVPQNRDWKVITLENEYIKVMVLPEIGGKVWGAIEKSTGKEFLYKNEVVKFRNIAMRGPWTSGGIEFNFGIIGHHPSTATPVDYVTKTNKDGSVSCVVGSTDLPSNTRWWVDIRLAKDKAFFETNASWYNASELNESYYNWMTAAAGATYDLEFFIPGNTYLEHNGDAHPWPIDAQGRNLSLYKENTFGPSKSYHVVGEYNDFFGGYYHDSGFGFGQWAPYEEMPGQKLWLWDLSRGGGIWEDLLTDTDGQYIEFQAGRLLDQYFPGAVNPISQVGFDPLTMDHWSEIWFPYKEIGGMVDASEHGVLNVEQKENETYIGLSALQKLNSELQITVNGSLRSKIPLDMKPMDVFSETISLKESDTLLIHITNTELSYTNEGNPKSLNRPFYPDKNFEVSTSQQLLQDGLEAIEYRDYLPAHKKLTELTQLDASHRTAWIRLGELEYRKTNYQKALNHALTVLKMDTYDSGANYLAGISYRALNDNVNALESFGWSARDVKYRSASYAQMAALYLAEEAYTRAKTYARKALNFNVFNLKALKVLAITARKQGASEKFQEIITSILEIDPLNHFVRTEISFMDEKNPLLEIQKGINNEFPDETLLSLTLEYLMFNKSEEALRVLGVNPTGIKNKLWSAYIQQRSDPVQSATLLGDICSANINLVFPYRRETIPTLQWAVSQKNHWKLRYYLAHNYLAVGEVDKGKSILASLKDDPDSDIFYRFRTALLTENSFEHRAMDYKKALQLSPKDWKVQEEYVQFLLKNKKYEDALKVSKRSYGKFPDNYAIGLPHAEALLQTQRYEEVLSVLNDIQVLPYEHARESRKIYERAHLGMAISYLREKDYQKAIEVLKKSKEWPENIGVGKPYEPDERLQDYLLARSYGEIGEVQKRRQFLAAIGNYTQNHLHTPSVHHTLGLLALKKLGKPKEISQIRTQLESKIANGDTRYQLPVALFENRSDTKLILDKTSELPKEISEALRMALSF